MFGRSSLRLARLCRNGLTKRTLATDGSDAPTKPMRSYPVLTGERGVNQVTLIGRMGRDPEVRGSEETPVIIFPLATSQTYKTPDGEFKQMTDWHRVVVFRSALGQIVANRMNKGDKVYVNGKLSYSRMQDGESNRLTTVAQVKADDVILLAKRLDKNYNEESAPTLEDQSEDIHK